MNGKYALNAALWQLAKAEDATRIAEDFVFKARQDGMTMKAIANATGLSVARIRTMVLVARDRADRRAGKVAA